MSTAGPVTIESAALWFPDDEVKVSGLPELADLPIAQREHALSLGIDTVRTGEGYSEVDLAHAAAVEALRKSSVDATQVDALLLVQGRVPQYLLASEATRLQRKLGASRAFTTTVGDLGCVSISAAFALAAALLRGDPQCHNVLVVAAAKSPTRSRYRTPMTLLGDGAAAVVVTTSGTGLYEILDQMVLSDGRYSDLFRIDYQDVRAADWVEECADEPTYSFRLAVESRKRFTEINAEILTRNGLERDAVGVFLMQNLSVGAFAFWGEALDVTIDPICRENLARFGHLGSVDIALNLERAASAQAPGEHTLIMNSSPVAAWSTALLRRLTDAHLGGK
ncbi:3-oxoacyl-ACP synthase [Rhodococcus sp. WMMA185]|uniref:3-oxoacyl-ACP synthase n=1 Tax=Rhodococcus sp. WMMA185 TaxID=679318 RepID=UPI00087862BC|nr:3-oxoacyl-ACP synthase [Rhodococcus sp. WMMA185]AOW93307.1 3-oxoacyl-ACP synthase [Rhodococcus sp. WMMA185]